MWVCLIILAIYCVLGAIYGLSTMRMFVRNERKEWVILSLFVWPVLLGIQMYSFLK